MTVFTSIVVFGLMFALAIGIAGAAVVALVQKTRIGIAQVLGFGLASVMAAGAAGVWASYRTGFMGPSTPECPGVTDPLDPAQRATVLACGETFLQFSEDPHGSADIQYLDVADPVTGRAVSGGPLAGTFPEQNIHRNRFRDLQAGRIVAKVWVDTAATAGYPKLGFGPGNNYVWIDGVNPPQGQVEPAELRQGTRPALGLPDAAAVGGIASRGTLRAVIIPSDPNFPVVVRPVDYYSHSRERGYRGHNQPQSQWIFVPTDVIEWMNCDKTGCCAVVGE
jgi:hypothetical protein